VKKGISINTNGAILHNWHSTFLYPTNANEPIEIPISNQSSIKVVKSKKSFKKDEKKGSIVESFQLTITNNQEKAAVVIEDTLFRSTNWELSKVTPANYYNVGPYHVRWEFPEFNIGEVQDIRYTVTYDYTGIGQVSNANANNNNNNANNSNNNNPVDGDKVEVNDEQKEEGTHNTSFFSKILSSSKNKKQKNKV